MKPVKLERGKLLAKLEQLNVNEIIISNWLLGGAKESQGLVGRRSVATSDAGQSSGTSFSHSFRRRRNTSAKRIEEKWAFYWHFAGILDVHKPRGPILVSPHNPNVPSNAGNYFIVITNNF